MNSAHITAEFLRRIKNLDPAARDFTAGGV